LKVEGHEFFYYAPPLFCSAPPVEGALRTPGLSQRCAVLVRYSTSVDHQ